MKINIAAIESACWSYQRRIITEQELGDRLSDELDRLDNKELLSAANRLSGEPLVTLYIIERLLEQVDTLRQELKERDGIL
ncbi:hypothetical protein CCP2SC5_740024 [Azospirillaceae bacterium]